MGNKSLVTNSKEKVSIEADKDEADKDSAIKYQLLGSSNDCNAKNILKDCNGNQEALRRMQALLSQWLRMENLVILTAAGCSHYCGGKTMPSLEESVLTAVKGVKDLSQETHRILEERLKNSEKKGFEQWLSYLVNFLYLVEESSSPIDSLTWKKQALKVEDMRDLINYISKAIYAECALTLPDDTASDDGKRKIAPHLSFLSKLVARDSNLGRTHLFTLNYDTLFEQAIELLGIQYFDGFNGRVNACFDPSVYGLDVYYPGELAEGRVRRFDKLLHFYKLHGSIHWMAKNNKIQAQHSNLEKYKDYQKAKNEEKAQQLCIDDFAPNYNDFGILPTSNKFVQTLDMPYAHLFRAFQARLSAPQTFFIVLGYGFGDDHVTQIIETALMNPSLIMLVVEPNPDSEIIGEISKYKELGKRAFVLTSTQEEHKNNPFKYATFNDFAKNILPDAQWLDDFLKLRRFEKQLQKNAEDNGKE